MTTDRRQDILEAALKVFSTQGFHKATIKQIAKEANLKSPALIYWYFEDKKALLQACITDVSPLGEFAAMRGEVAEQMMDQPPEVVIQMIAQGITGIGEDETLTSMFRLYFSEAMRTPEVAEVVGDFQQMMLQLLERYLTRQIELERLRPHNVRTSARMMIGTMLAYLMGTQIFTQGTMGFPEREQYIQEVTDILLKGLARHE